MSTEVGGPLGEQQLWGPIREFYFLDEISPYLDIGQRVTAARLIDELRKAA